MSDIRNQLIEGGVRLLERDGPQALSVRNLAAEAGTSTMAVYTHFGGVGGVIDAVAGEAFTRFAQALTEAAETDDPVADFFVMGAAYRDFAIANPQRYQLIFGATPPAAVRAGRTDADPPGRVDDAASFDALRHSVRRMIAAGRIRDEGDLVMASRLWSLSHGAVMLEMAGFFGHDGQGLTHILGPLAQDVIVGMGDSREAATRSYAAADRRLDLTGPAVRVLREPFADDALR